MRQRTKVRGWVELIDSTGAMVASATPAEWKKSGGAAFGHVDSFERVVKVTRSKLAPLITISAWTKDRGAINSMTAEGAAVCARVWKCSNGWRAHVMALGPDTTSFVRLRETKAEAMKVADECLALLGYVARKAER